MTLSRLARILLVPLVLVAVALGATGCGGGSGDPGPVGTLELTNDAFSLDVVDRVDIDEVGGPDHFSFFADLFPGETIAFDLFPASYDVTIFWASGAIEIHPIDIFDGFVTFLTVSN